jgi:hypothetical protein
LPCHLLPCHLAYHHGSAIQSHKHHTQTHKHALRLVMASLKTLVKAHDLFSKGGKAESERCRNALKAVAPGVDQGFIHDTIYGMDAPGYRGDYPETWADFDEFDTRWRLDWVKLYAHHQATGEYVHRVEDQSERSIWFPRGRKEAIESWQRPI